MAKKAKDTTAATTKKKAAAPLDPVKTGKLLRLLGAVALILAIAAFALQLLAVLSHHWKWQSTIIDPLAAHDARYPRTHIYNDSRLDQQYGLYSRNVKLYANNDEQLDLWGSTRFPRLDADEDSLHRCLSQTSTLRGAFLTCSPRVVSPDDCHCRRHAYWNWVIFFEITALILLGISLLLTALVSTEFHPLLRLAAAGLAILAFLFLFIGLILILSHLKRETRSLADAYPHIHRRLTGKLGLTHEPIRGKRTKQSLLHQIARRQAHETYRLYPLGEGQHPHNATHYQEFSHELNNYVFKPYSDLYPAQAGAYAPYAQQGRQGGAQEPRRQQVAQSSYGPVIGYDQVFDHTRAGIGWSTVLSILAMILSLLYPLLLVYAWLTDKKLNPPTKTKTTTTTTTTTTKAEYTPLTQDIPASETVTARPIPTDYDHRRPIGEALVKTQHVPRPASEITEVRQEPVIVRDVVITDAEHPTTQTTTHEHTATTDA